MKLTHLGDWVPSLLFGSDLLLPMLERLRDATGETVTLTMATGLHMRVLKALIGTHPIALQLDEGLLFPIFDTSVGNAYLSTLPDATIATLLQRRNAQTPRGQALTLADVMTAVAGVRANGYAVAYDKIVADTGAVAVPLASSQVGETLVIAVAGLNSRIARDEARLIREMKRLVKGVDQLAAAT